MLTKYNIARKVARSGIRVVIANGKEEQILQRILNDDFTGTTFVSSRKASNLKKWIAHSEGFAKGAIQINEGAKQALTSDKATSLLPVGVINISGAFKKGDLIRILDENNRPVAIGKAQYASDKAEELKGLKNQKPLVHYDYLYLYS
jgi:glutamate 5-kinase